MESENCDPTWNHPARSVLIYALPLSLAAACLHWGWFGLTRDFWVPLLWGFVVPAWNTRRRAGKPWAFKDYMNRDCYPPTIALMHAAVWCSWVNLAPNLISAALGFGVSMLLYDALMIRYRLLCVYAVGVEAHEQGTLSVLFRYGIAWWAYVGGGFAACHALGSDTAGSVLLMSAAMILPAQVLISLWQRLRSPSQRLSGIRRVAVIGAGWNGIYATKWLAECGLEVTCFDRRSDIGGVWNYRRDAVGGVFEQTRATSSKHFLHACDFPFDPSVPDFPDHVHVLDYLRGYVSRFGLLRRFRLDTEVLSAQRCADGWHLRTRPRGESPREAVFDALVVCSGPQGKPRLEVDSHPIYAQYQGKVVHAEAYKEASDIAKGERVLIVGAGESAADIVAECVAAGAEVHWSTHRGQWFADRNIGPHAADHFTAIGIRALFGRFVNVEYLIRRFIIANFINIAWGCGGHGIRRWAPAAPYLHQFLNKSRDGILDVYRGKVTPHGQPTMIAGKAVSFDDADKPLIFDRVVLATGYRPSWPFLDDPPKVLYQKVFDPADLTMAFVGFARPVLGSIPSLGEMQARWVAHVYSGKVALPARDRRDVALFHDRADQQKRFSDSSLLGVLVDQEVYATQLASYVGAEVRWLKLLVRQPRAFWATLFSPWIAFKYRLNDPDPAQRAAAAENIQRELPDRSHPVYLLAGLIAVVGVLLVLGIGAAFWFLPPAAVAAAIAALTLAAAALFRLSEPPATRNET